jgi:hypothetical protein
MDISDCKSVDNSTLVGAIDTLTAERDERVTKLMRAGVKKGRPFAIGKNGSSAPEGDLDRETAGDA